MTEQEQGIKYLPAEVFVRIRPLADSGGHAGRQKKENREDFCQLGKFDEESVDILTATGWTKNPSYNYMKTVVLPQDSQETTFTKLGLPGLIELFLGGYNTTFLAYGQTGTGKTHTMFGSNLDAVKAHNLESKQFPEGWGIFPRAIMQAMEIMKERESESVKYVFTANVIEIYFFQVFDLLNNRSTVHANKWGGGDWDFQGVHQIEIASTKDVSKLIDIMHTNRQSRATGMNDQSSRSHCVASINLLKIEKDKKGHKKVSKSSFCFVDLAGSERVEKTGNEAKKSESSWEGICTN